ncbi:site-specific integrase [Desulfosporosinus sp. Sb-LF]|uniref:site-specific integrase n=1 Tax=Desulfosporosinus sp. Sb-LF TaxID=2560027 RepID=UPI00107EF58B|nr:site-specific integrase [Desulfosporosinus sp. Sb-LF]TGE31128.1 hypothetical protein E4K68_19000 [Desulfosporosinus sp. Sb-LF]
MSDKTMNLKLNLICQVNKLMNRTNSHSIETRHRYEDATERFCGFIAEEFRLQKFKNVKPKHFESYVAKMVTDGYSGKTITTDLSGIRFFHELSESRFILPTNSELKKSGVNIPPVEVGIVDRAWTDIEIEKAKAISSAMGRLDVTAGIDLSRNFGLRINELSSLRVSQLKNALISDELIVKGKGGVVRIILVRTAHQVKSLNAAINYAIGSGRDRYSDRVLASSEKGGVRHKKESLQNWISNHRKKFEEDFRQKYSANYESQKAYCESQGFKLNCENISWHGLRHAYAQERYEELCAECLSKGLSHENAAYQARKEVSHELGHYRDSITNVYLR